MQLTNGALGKNPPLIVNGGPLALCAAVNALLKDGPVLYCPVAIDAPRLGKLRLRGNGLIARLPAHAGWQIITRHGASKKIAILNGIGAPGNDADAILADVIKLPEYAYGMSYTSPTSAKPYRS